MMKEELIDHIKDQLGNFELDYRDGAWEEFREREKSERPFLFGWKVRAAAAILIICSIFLPGTLSHLSDESTLTHRTIVLADKSPKTNDSGVRALILKREPLREPDKTGSDSLKNDNHYSLTHIHPLVHDQKVQQDSINTNKALTLAKNNVSDEQKKLEVPKPKSFEEMLAQERQHTPHRETMPANRKWGFAVSLGQAIDNRSKTDLSFGAHVSYKLNEHLSVSSGLMYDESGAAKKNPLPASSARIGKFSTGSEASLSGITVPLELRIKAGKKMYANVGLSAYAILKQHQTVNFREDKTVTTSYIDDKGTMQTATANVSEMTTEAVPQQELKQNKIAGFYNLSIGFRQKISASKAIALEPFIKIPISGYSAQQLNLIQGGIRVKVGF